MPLTQREIFIYALRRLCKVWGEVSLLIFTVNLNCPWFKPPTYQPCCSAAPWRLMWSSCISNSPLSVWLFFLDHICHESLETDGERGKEKERELCERLSATSAITLGITFTCSLLCRANNNTGSLARGGGFLVRPTHSEIDVVHVLHFGVDPQERKGERGGAEIGNTVKFLHLCVRWLASNYDTSLEGLELKYIIWGTFDL